jgi:hypothetical protein
MPRCWADFAIGMRQHEVEPILIGVVVLNGSPIQFDRARRFEVGSHRAGSSPVKVLE